MSGVLYKLINSRAVETFGGNISVENYKDWENHWFNTAEQLAVVFSSDELPETANAVRVIICDQKKLLENLK